MNDRQLKRRLTEYLDQSKDAQVEPEQLMETVDLCVAVMREQTAPAASRQSFWAFLSEVFHFEGIPILLSQLAVLFATCLVAGSSPMSPYELPRYMPLFILTVMPIFFRGQRYRVSEVEAVTRTSGALLVLVRLVLAGMSALVCVTFLLALEVWLQRSWENLGWMVIYCLVPYLTCMTAMLALLRRRRKDGASLCAAFALGSVVFWRYSAHLFPWLYEASALGIWVAAVLVYSWLFAKEVVFIVHARQEIDMYGIVD